MSIPVLAKLKVLEDRFLDLIETRDELEYIEKFLDRKKRHADAIKLNYLINYAKCLLKECFSESKEEYKIKNFIKATQFAYLANYL